MFSNQQHIFSLSHLFYFVHLGRKTFLTESKQRAICEAGAAVGGRDELKKPTFKDHIEAGATWASLRAQNCQQPRSQDLEPGGQGCAVQLGHAT